MSIQFEPLGESGFHVGEIALRAPAGRVRAVNNDQLGMLCTPMARITSTGVITRHTSVALRTPAALLYAGRPNVALVTAPMQRTYARDISIDVTLELVFLTAPAMTVSAGGRIRRRGEAHVVAPARRVLGTDMSSFGAMVVPAKRVLTYDLPPPERYVIALQTPGYLYAEAGAGVQSLLLVTDSVTGVDSVLSHLTIHIIEVAHGLASAASTLRGTSAASSSAAATDAVAIVIDLIASSEAVATDNVEAYLDMLLHAADVVVAAGLAESQLTAFVAVAIVAELGDRADLITLLAVEAVGVVIDEAAIDRIGLLVHALSTAAAVADPEAMHSMVIVGSSTVLAGDTAELQLAALAEAFAEGLVGAAIRVGNDVYSVHAMTLTGAAVSEYVGMPINSQGTLGGRMYGASEQGIVLMEGATDDGDPINASVRLGLDALGTQLFKAVPAVYLGYTSTGAMLVKVTSTDKGVKHTNVYKVNPVRKDVVSDGRVTPTKGKHSVYFGFEIANYEGSDFELETVQVWRMVLSRRK